MNYIPLFSHFMSYIKFILNDNYNGFIKKNFKKFLNFLYFNYTATGIISYFL